MTREVLPVIEFRKRIKVLVEMAGSAEKLAHKSAVSARIIGKYLAGESLPGLEKLIALAEAGGVTVQWLATGEGPMRRGDKAEEEGPGVDKTLLTQALQLVDEIAEKSGGALNAGQTADLAVNVYENLKKIKDP